MILFFNPGHLQNSRNPTLDKLGPSLIITALVKNLKFCQPKDTPKEEYNKETHEYRNWTEERKEKYCNEFLAVLNRQSALKSGKKCNLDKFTRHFCSHYGANTSKIIKIIGNFFSKVQYLSKIF